MKYKEYVRILRELKLVLILIPIVAMLTGAAISLYVLTPVYRSTATIVMLKDQKPPEGDILLVDYRMVKTCAELATSRAVAEEVIKSNNLNFAPGELLSKIKVELAGDTAVLKIRANDFNPSVAALVANEVARVLSGEAYKILNINNVKIVDYAVPSSKPFFPNTNLNILLAGILGLIISLAIVFIREYLDDVRGEGGISENVLREDITEDTQEDIDEDMS